MTMLQLFFMAIVIFPVTNGDCFDEPPNNGSYDNCATCFQTFANAIINTGDNKYEMSRKFFPIDVIPPVQVQVTYHSHNDSVKPRVWYWLMGGFYIFQPLKLFLYRSLFFSPPSWREETLTIQLPRSCFGNDLNETKAREFFRYATQRLKGYAQSQTAIPQISNSYIGKAVQEKSNEDIMSGIHDDFDATILQVVYVVPTLSVMMLFPFVALVGYNFIFNSDEKIDALKQKPRLQANIVTLLLLCSIFTSYIIILDFISLKIEVSHLPGYFSKNAHGIFILVSLFSLFVSLLFGISLILLFIGIMYYNNDSKVLKVCYIASSLNVGSFVILLTFHLPNILMAWATDPFYASKIGLYYLMVGFMYFLSFHYSYYLPHKLIQLDELYPGFLKNIHILLIVSLIVSFVTVTGFIVPILTLVIKIPVNNSLESSADGITNAYDSIIVLIVGGLVAYRVIRPYITTQFSFENSLKQAMREMEAPHGIDEWEEAENKRLTKVMIKIISKKCGVVEQVDHGQQPGGNPANPSIGTEV